MRLIKREKTEAAVTSPAFFSAKLCPDQDSKQCKIRPSSISANSEKVEHVVRTGFPAIVQCLLKLSLEELDCFLVGVIRHQSLAQVVHVLETRDFRQTSVHHHQKQRDEKVGVMPQDLVCIDAQLAEPINHIHTLGQLSLPTIEGSKSSTSFARVKTEMSHLVGDRFVIPYGS